MAAELGSDVPFFLCGGEADATGRGETVTPVEAGPTRDLLLLVPPFSISTAGVYRAYAGRGTLPARLEVDDSGRREYFGPNDLTPAVLIMEPRMEGYLASAARVTPDFVVSGSGATIALHGAGQDAAGWLEKRHPEARFFRCRTLSRQDYRERTNPVEA
jgi:4-diphosphocytidyl-2C-methyl-D-erythritol kinase